ncbi:hypothetical protein M430DRAFT_155783 [Amorphotheca resinae ATCC 22711]|uniref:Uncharacterized protein n=1 Tax=Amorphotheca resinae ATCC 22711 TaxID=857342 RepID=A0A2T3BDW0_AMORE|nr:hypothetical protein M430DRAFT_155783 [Amorphotheca resinae ATCC 22711]PSS27575.1 hypothetical protein M430DRAFT_155783 [Amorphotheca resinae ATCC 22711]
MSFIWASSGPRSQQYSLYILPGVASPRPHLLPRPTTSTLQPSLRNSYVRRLGGLYGVSSSSRARQRLVELLVLASGVSCIVATLRCLLWTGSSR